jgi:hypothetical protein
MIEDMTIRNLSPAIVRPRGFEVQPIFWPLAGSARVGRRPRLEVAFRDARPCAGDLTQALGSNQPLDLNLEMAVRA